MTSCHTSRYVAGVCLLHQCCTNSLVSRLLFLFSCRLYLGDNFTLGNPESVSYNPVQSEVADLGIIRYIHRLCGSCSACCVVVSCKFCQRYMSFSSACWSIVVKSCMCLTGVRTTLQHAGAAAIRGQ